MKEIDPLLAFICEEDDGGIVGSVAEVDHLLEFTSEKESGGATYAAPQALPSPVFVIEPYDTTMELADTLRTAIERVPALEIRLALSVLDTRATRALAPEEAPDLPLALVLGEDLVAVVESWPDPPDLAQTPPIRQGALYVSLAARFIAAWATNIYSHAHSWGRELCRVANLSSLRQRSTLMVRRQALAVCVCGIAISVFTVFLQSRLPPRLAKLVPGKEVTPAQTLAPLPSSLGDARLTPIHSFDRSVADTSSVVPGAWTAPTMPTQTGPRAGRTDVRRSPVKTLSDAPRVDRTARRTGRREARVPSQPRLAIPPSGPPAGFRGSLAVTSSPQGAEVFVNGVAVGATPLLLRDVPAGSRVVRVEMEGHQRWSSAVRVVANQQTLAKAELRPVADVR